MKFKWVIIVAVFMFNVLACSQAGENSRKKVVITTEFGNITIELYDETPLHRDNFIKLAKEGFYDGIIFHRVIENFMIQGGNPAYRAGSQKNTASGNADYQIPAEIKPQFYHKKGAVAAARQGDQVNPERQSSGSQFYIVQGTVYRTGELDTLEIRMNYQLQQNILRKYVTESQDELNKFREAGDQAGFNKKVAELRAAADSAFHVAEKTTIPENRRNDYTTIGGYPSLDGAYTVFGQVIDGLEVVDKIAAVETNQSDRPLKDVVMSVKVIE